MMRRFWFPLFCATGLLGAAAQCLPASAQPVTRIKARLVSIDGAVLTLTPLSPADKVLAARAGTAGTGDNVTVSVTPDTRYVGAEKSDFSAIKIGDYIGAAVTQQRGQWLRAQIVYLYAEALRGSGEGRFAEGDRLLINGAVSAVKPTAPQDTSDGTVSVHYHGAGLTNAVKGQPPLCEGRATPAPFASPLACEADATIEVLPGTPVEALTIGDQALLTPGAVVTVAMMKMADGKIVTPGVIVEKPVTTEKPVTAEKPGTAEKPQSSQ
jgi:hypothetical protein